MKMPSPRALALLLYLSIALTGVSAYESLKLSPGQTAKITVPAVAPFTSLADTRLEFRIHGWSVPSSDYAQIMTLGSFIVWLRSSDEVCVGEYADSLQGYGNTMCAELAGKTDVIVRVQRNTAGKLLQLDVVASDTGRATPTYCGSKRSNTAGNVFPCPITNVNLRSWAGTGSIGDAVTNVQIAWIKWYSTLVPSSGGGFDEFAPADLADWRFEGNTANQQAGSAVSIAGLTGSYGPTPRLRPVCHAGAQQTFRAGFPAQLDGSLSYALDGGGAPRYLWQQISGPSTVHWSRRSSAKPRITNLVFGSYVVQLTVTDSSGQSCACTVKHGAVASDDNGVIITNNPGVDTLLGPMIRFGANPWPWFDDRHKAAADIQLANLDPYFPGYWDIAGPGTITVTGGSATVTGAGTLFTTTVCQGPGNPSVPKQNSGIVVWYPTNVAEQTGRRQLSVASCQSDTQLTLSGPWKTDVKEGSGLNYTAVDPYFYTLWAYNNSPANFYDNVAAFYSLYYRSGIDDYLFAARKLADRFWASPQIDRGEACTVVQGMSGCFPPRAMSVMGLVLRALDGRPEMWSGLHLISNTFMEYYLNGVDAAWGPGLWDMREEAYHLAMVSYCALFDPDAVYRAKCKTSISNSFAPVWTAYRMPDGGWGGLYVTEASWLGNHSANLTLGSTSVTGNGTTWTPGKVSVWFTNQASPAPFDNSAGDPTYYTATVTDATHMVLDRAYEGTTGIHGWQLTSDKYGYLGHGGQPFMEGILSAAFDLASKAIADSDPANSALARSYNIEAANWIKRYGYRTATNGMYYGAEFVNCQAPIGEFSSACTKDNSVEDSRVLSAEAMRGIMTAYGYNGDPALRDFGDTLFSAMFSKPNTGGPNPDGQYITSLNDGTGWYMTGTPPIGKATKYFGMFFGFSGLSAWPGYRVGGLQPASSRSLHVVFDLAAMPNAVRARVVVTAPNGEVSQVDCAASPCKLTVDGRQGDHILELQYLSEGGAVLSSGEIPLTNAARQLPEQR